MFKLIGEYNGRTIPTRFLHSGGCGKEFITKPANLSKNGVYKIFCEHCSEKSKGEYLSKKILEDLEKDNSYNIKFEYQKRFDDCRDKRPLPFDFAIYNNKSNKLIFLIEFDGQQHKKQKGSIFSAGSRFETIQKHDKIKTEYCKKKKIPLLRMATAKETTIKNKILKMLEKFNDYHK